MAERRMFARSIVLSDAFLDMPLSARCLYFTLSMFADDDGFVSSPKGIMRQCGASQDDIAVLISKRFILGFESGVIVIKHWRINNYLRNDRKNDTTYLEELAMLELDEKGAYTEKKGTCLSSGRQVVGKCLPNDRQMPASGIPSIVEYSRVEDSLVEGSISSADDEEFSTEFSTNNVETTPATATEEENNFSEYDDNELHAIGGRGLNVVYLTERQEEMLLDKMDVDGYNYYLSKLARFIVDKNATVKNHYETLCKWYDEDRQIRR